MTTTSYIIDLDKAQAWNVRVGRGDFEIVRETMKKGRPALVLMIHGVERTVLRSHTTIDIKSEPVQFAEPVSLEQAFAATRGVIDPTLLRR